MKKLFSILMVVAMLAALAVPAFAAPATTQGTVYDFVANFDDLTDTCFSFGVYHKVHSLMQTTTKWYPGATDQEINNETGAGKHPGSGQPLKGYGYYNSDGWGCSTGYIGEDIVWATGDNMINIIVFTAPVTGLYSYDMEGRQLWDTNASSALYYVKVNDEVHNGNTKTFEQGLAANATNYNFEGSVELNKGQTICFYYDPETNSAGDNGLISKLQVKLDRVGKAPLTNEVGTVYDLVGNFTTPEYANYSFAVYEDGVGLLDSTSTWYNGDDANVKHAGTNGPLTGFNVTSDGKTVALGYIGTNIVWYPSGTTLSNAIIFTAPVAGTYSYEFSSYSLWKVEHSSADYAVSINGGAFEKKSVPTVTEAGDPSRVTFTGSVTLNAGDTIMYLTEAAGNSAGDNNVLETVKVTLTALGGPATPSNPTTSNVAVSIAVAIATAAVVGLAVVVKKH